MKGYSLSKQAQEEIFSTVDYISDDSPSAAEKWLDQIEVVCGQLAGNPLMGRERPELGEGVRSFPVGKFIIFYQVRSAGVFIVHVVRGARRLEAYF